MNVGAAGCRTLLCAAALLVGACAIDFNDSVPCDSNNDCLAGERCDQDFARCVDEDEAPRDARDGEPGDADEVDAPGGSFDATTDADTIDTDASDGGEVDVTADADLDASEDTTTDIEAPDTSDASQDGSGDADVSVDIVADVPDGCTPTDEVCDGLDNDCDGVPDNGLDCGPCGAGAALVENGEERFCIDRYEASRADATADEVGVAEGGATSRAGVLPWAGVTFDEARQACEAGGRRLCSGAEWQLACRGAGGQLYPYAGAYQGDACHGVNAPPPGTATPGGSFDACESPFGLFDQSGNVAEWTADLFVRGGSFEDPELTLQCRSRRASASGQSPTSAIGFRCCSEP